MQDHVIDPEPSVAQDRYVTPDRWAEGWDGRPEALPRGAYSVLGTADDGASNGADDGASNATLQPAWGWGAAPAYPTDGTDTATAITRLPSNPTLYTARQQDAARRDIAARLGTYAEYWPEPFVSR